MADNATLPAAGDSIRAIDKSGTKTQVVTLDLGGSGAESLVNGAIPVTGTFWQATQPVSGSVSVSNLPATQAVSGTVELGATSLAALETVSLVEAQNTLRQVLAEMNQPQAPIVKPAPRPKAIRVGKKHDEEDDEHAINAAVLLLMH